MTVCAARSWVSSASRDSRSVQVSRRIAKVARFAAGACVAVSTLAMMVGTAEARMWRHAHRHYHVYASHRQAIPEGPAFSAIVVDANTGKEIYGVNEDAQRHPASITKVMTLYLLFEQLDKGALTLNSRIPISEHAAAQEPSKLGIAAGDSISVEDAIKAVVTRSANDVAVAIAEAIGHDESTFADMMTRKAHALGMSRTLYRNASGLPNDEQLTTAHDLSVLARATEERFPQYFHYFSTHEFEYDGEIIGNHNHLLGRVDGVDGIKTGYTRASGFNLLTSVHRDGRSLVAVVMGGRTAAARDHVMENLISDHIAEASNHGHSATMIADNEAPEPPPAPLQLAAAHASATAVASNFPTPAARHVDNAAGEGDDSAEDEEAAAPRVSAVLPPAKIAARVAAGSARPVVSPIPPAALETPRVALAPEPPRVERTAAVEPRDVDPRDLGWAKGADPAPVAALKPVAAVAPKTRAEKIAADKADKAAAKLAAAAKLKPPVRSKDETRITRSDDANDDDSDRSPKSAGSHQGWMIQIGATDDAAKANELLIRARAQNRSTLASAKAVTEKVRKGEDIFYRARFAGLDSASAETACRSLKRAGFSCFTSHD